MKNSIHFLCFIFFISLFPQQSFTQIDLASFIPKGGKEYILEKNDGTEFIGKIISFDAREVLIETTSKGQIIIPKHEVKQIKELGAEDFSESGRYLSKEVFATRYFITTNGLPIEKGEHYTQWNLFGPDFQFAVSDNFGLGIMTSWLAVPIIGTAKYTISLGKNTNLAIGVLAGTFSWASIRSGLVLPYTAISFGNRRSNLTFSAGYGAMIYEGDSKEKALAGLAGMTKITEKISLVFDSFIVPALKTDDEGFALIIPGIRWQSSPRQAFQFGFAGMYVSGDIVPFPIPMVQWFRKLN